MKRHIGFVPGTAAAGMVLAAAIAPAAAAAPPEPFKQTNIHFETNSSACDMGVQMSFDTEGITEGEIEGPFEQSVFTLRSVRGLEETHDVTEMFQERVEPPIVELEQALGCEPSEDAITLTELLSNWPAGTYEFDGTSGRTEFEGAAVLTHRIPAGPEILAPEDGAIVAHDANLLIRWRKVTGPLLSYLGPVEVVGYHVVIADVTNAVLAPGRTKTVFDADLSKSETSMLVAKQFLEPGRIYEFEVLATEKGGNQTITEGGVFCTPPVTEANCEAP